MQNFYYLIHSGKISVPIDMALEAVEFFTCHSVHNYIKLNMEIIFGGPRVSARGSWD